MLTYIGRRVVLSVATLLVIATATFFLMRTIPGGPFSSERALPAAVEANLVKKYRLDDPLWLQFTRYLGALSRGDLGPSFLHEDRTTNQVIAEGFPKSATLGLTGFLIAFSFGVPAGILAAMRRRTYLDRGLMVAAVMGVSVPSFILASLLQYWIAYRFGWAPAAGWGDSPFQVLLPALALSAFPIAFISRLVRNSMLDVLNSDYLRTASAKGLSRFSVILKHGLRNAMLPAVTYSGPLLASLLTGSFVVETIFAVPGLGRYFVSSINDRDYTVIMGVTLFYSMLLITFNLVVDVVYTVLDPRLRDTL